MSQQPASLEATLDTGPLDAAAVAAPRAPHRVKPSAVAALPRVLVWDLPLRVFHWALVVLVSAAIATGLAGGPWMAWHGRAGQAIAGLLVFRLTWGLWGTRYARFRQFLPTPSRVWAYLQGRWQGHGHNPLGALSVLAVLVLLLLQVGTGLFGNDEISFTGPWSGWVDEDTSLRLTGWHKFAAKALYAWLGLHVLAIAVYGLWLRRPLLQAMVTGRAPGAVPAAAGRVSIVLLLVSVGLGVALQLLF
ncbi:cytochrome b/b6 domain-containing protein [Roseateles cellulosilyticus]|uniref:Cytochrome b/b6 domain-containing protein n=1 Tax=Pelomonas cellulosilytica TaxID=2906762 RepID=A0ABS8XMJ0_9BURK|nr:cytochrome b/b6 domain-containing protein [Pelomonas sp. P8]MCE4553997.1 cytochrome b/b6 domain-containing protein [Pelomonas sp. P8]